MKAAFDTMIRHMAWADRRTGAALARFGEEAGVSSKHIAVSGRSVSSGEGASETAGAVLLIGEAVRLYAHIVAAETIWISRLNDDERFGCPAFPEWDVASARAKSEETLEAYDHFLATCEDYDHIVEYKTSSGDLRSVTIADVLTNICLHGSHHRGQINRCLRAAGLEPVNVSYFTFR